MRSDATDSLFKKLAAAFLIEPDALAREIAQRADCYPIADLQAGVESELNRAAGEPSPMAAAALAHAGECSECGEIVARLRVQRRSEFGRRAGAAASV